MSALHIPIFSTSIAGQMPLKLVYISNGSMHTEFERFYLVPRACVPFGKDERLTKRLSKRVLLHRSTVIL